MKIEKFADEVLWEVKKKTGGVFSVQITKAVKNNGVKLAGISASDTGTNVRPCIYLNGYYEGYIDGKVNVSEAAEDVYRQIIGHMDDFRGINLEGFCRWETARDNIYAKLVNAEMNKELLEDVPHREFLDLAAVYYAKVEEEGRDGGSASILINNSHMEMWQEEENSLYRVAVKNMRTDGKPLFEDMRAVMRGMLAGGTGSAENVPSLGGIYVLTNRHKLFGAAELLDGDTLKGIGDKLGGDFIVLPSSIHETVIVPKKEGYVYTELAGMVREINETQVAEEERLSDHVYVYDSEDGVLKVAA